MAVWYATTFPPMAYDYYHLNRAALFLQEGNIGPWEGWDRGVSYYPGNAEIIFGYVLLGTRSNSAVVLVQGLFGLFLSLAVYRICRNMGVRVAHSAVAGMLLWSSTVVFHESYMALNDLMMTSMVGIGFMYLTERKIGWIPVMLSGLSFGWAMGSKASTIYWLVGAVIYLIYRLIAENHKPKWMTSKERIEEKKNAVIDLLGNASAVRGKTNDSNGG